MARGSKPGVERGPYNTGDKAYEETIIRKRVPLKPSQQEKVKAKVNLALRDHEHMSAAQFCETAFSVEEIDELWVERLLPNGDNYKIGRLTRAVFSAQEDFEPWFLSQYHGPGKFLLKPAVGGWWVGPMKTVRLGTGDDIEAGYDQGVDVDRELGRVLKRESSLAAITQLKRLNNPAPSTKEDEDEMKVDDFTKLVTAIAALRGEGGGDGVAALREELRGLREELHARPAGSATDLLAQLVQSPAITTLLGFIPRSLIGKILMGLVPRPPEAPPAPTPPSFVDQLRSILEQPTVVQTLAPLVQVLAAKLGAPASAAPHPQALTTGGPAVATFQTEDDDLKEQITYIVQMIGERKFADAYATFKAEPVLHPFVAAIAPGVEPIPFWNKVKTLDARLRPMLDNGLDFVRHVQTQIEVMLAQMEAEQRREAREQAP